MVVSRYFVLGLIIGVNWGTIPERLSAPCHGYFNVKRVHEPQDQEKRLKDRQTVF